MFSHRQSESVKIPRVFSLFFSDTLQLNTFNAVFVPTFLSIIGVIFYLRLGYIVGSAGILGAIAIIILAVSVTMSTALSLSSITTNIKIGDGGAYSIVSKTLGLEVGGSVGIPLYLAQIFSVALYLFGFAEAWKFIFPQHPSWIVLLLGFGLLFSLITLSVKVALKIQLLVFTLVVLSILAVLLPFDRVHNQVNIGYIGEFQQVNFWTLFALFFPAVTGLMAGIGLSGELSNPRKQIPQGVLLATGITALLYLVMVFWFGQVTTATELLTNNTVMVQYARSGTLVLIGILGATYSSALTTFLAAPRLLAGMAQKGILPYSSYLERKTKSGVPLIATMVTGGIIASSFLLGSIDSVAPVLTMFFLIAYAAINAVVFIEQSLGLPSFRPKLKIPKIIPFYGMLGAISCMFLINGFAAAISIVLLLSVYAALIKRNLVSEEGDIRSGLFMVMAEWAAKRVIKLPESQRHVWKPSILFPTMTSSNLRGHFPLLHGIVSPNGTLTVLGMQHAEGDALPEDGQLSKLARDRETTELIGLVKSFGKQDIFTSFSDISIKDYAQGICISLEAIEGQVFHPNILFLPFAPDTLPKRDLSTIYQTALRHKVGVLLFAPNYESRLGSQKDILVWLPEEALHDENYIQRSFDLAMLIAYTLHKNWNSQITLCMATKQTRKANKYLKKIIAEARFPNNTQTLIVGDYLPIAVAESPESDLHIVSMVSDDVDTMKMIAKIDKSILFVTDAGNEDIFS